LQKCDIDCYKKCQKDVYVNTQCILHCKKNNYQKDRHSGLLSDFYDEFIDYTIERLFEHIDLLDKQFSEEEIRTYFKSNTFDNQDYNKVLKNTIFIPSFIHFPTRDGRDTFDYLKLLNLFGQIHFNYCEFYISSLDLKNISCFFQDCKFHDRWTLYNYNVLENEDNVIYQTCEFYKTVSNYTPEKSSKLAIYTNSQFDYTCKFKDSIEFNNVDFLNALFDINKSNNNLEENYIKFLKLNNCKFKNKFILNDYRIGTFICIDSLFKEKFEFKRNKLQIFFIDNSNFEKLVDFFKSNFKEFKIHKSIFKAFVGFEKCIYGTKNNLKKEIAIFKYVTFTDFLNFRNSKFKSGLNIDSINVKEAPNFLKIKVKSKHTNRETFRIIKHSFDKIGNIIEANKFYRKEIQKREKELEEKIPKKFFDWIIFKAHDISSKHSQNALLPLFWIFIISYMYSYIFNFLGNKNCYINILHNKFLNSIVHYIYSTDMIHLFMLSFLMSLPFIVANSFIKKNYYFLFWIFTTFIYIHLTKDYTLSIVSNNMNPFSIITEKGELNFHELLYRITIAYLMYQFIISIRQNTRRK